MKMEIKNNMIYTLESKLHTLVSYISYSEGEGWRLDFLKGLLLDVPQKKDAIFIEVENPKVPLPDYFDVQGVPIVNKKVIDALESVAVDNFQAFPVEIHFEDGITSGYFLLNVVGRLECIDLSLSKVSKFGPCIARIFDLKLVENAADGCYMFRAHEYQEIIFIHEHVKKEIEKANISGCEIWNADGWSDAHRF